MLDFLAVLTATVAPEKGVFLPELYNAADLGLDEAQTNGLVALCGAYTQEARQIAGAAADRRGELLADLFPGHHHSPIEAADLDVTVMSRLDLVAQLERAYTSTIRRGFALLTPEQVTQASEIRRALDVMDAARFARAVAAESSLV